MKIYIDRADDRDAAVQILARNGYTVRIDRKRANKGSRYEYFVEATGRDEH